MAIKLKNRYFKIVLFIISVYMVAFSLIAAFDVDSNRRYLDKEIYFSTQQFQTELERSFTDIRKLIENDEINDVNINEEMNNNFIKYYIEDSQGNVVYSDFKEGTDISDLSKDEFVYMMNLENNRYYYINEWFYENDFEGVFFVQKGFGGNDDVIKDYNYYLSLRERVIKEIILGSIAFIMGIIILIYTKKKYNFKIKQFKYVENIKNKYQDKPIDLRIAIFLIILFIIKMWLNNINFFYFPIGIRHSLILNLVSIYVIYVVFSISNFISVIVKDKELNKELNKSFINMIRINIIDCFRNIKTVIKVLLVLGCTVFFGIMIGVVLSYSGDGFPVIYILVYLIFIPYYLVKKLGLFNRIVEASRGTSLVKLTYEMDKSGEGSLYELASNINNMKEEYEKSVDSQVKSERLKTELITNVSHDLKTPLTSIINYVDFLKKEDLSPEERLKYINVIDTKSQKLKVLIEDLFEASKMSSGNVEFNIEKIDIAAILSQALGEMNERIKSSSLIFKVDIQDESIYLNLDGNKTWRVIDNLLNNILKYSMPNTRVYVELKDFEDFVTITMKNISSYEMNFDENEIFERFKRGDKARNTEGSGLGLAIARDIVELQGGSMNISIDGDLFKVVVSFHKNI
ncbi:sensor histidine kinase [Clostridium sp. DL1XJH146]